MFWQAQEWKKKSLDVAKKKHWKAFRKSEKPKINSHLKELAEFFLL